MLALALAALAALLHLLFFLMESVLFMRESVYRRFGVDSREDAEKLRLLALNQGFYNLFLAAGCATGVALAAMGQPLGVGLITYCSLFMLGAAVVLVLSEPKLARAAVIQGGPPAAVLLLLLT